MKSPARSKRNRGLGKNERLERRKERLGENRKAPRQKESERRKERLGKT
jgi:hypothetical protein